MNSKEKNFLKKISKLVFKRVNVTRKAKILWAKNIQQHQKYINKSLSIFNPLISKLSKYKNISYKFKKNHIFEFYYSDNQNKSQLIFSITLFSLLTPTSMSIIKPPYIEVNYFKNNNNLKEKLEILSFVGEISRYLLKNNSTITSKLISYSNNYMKFRQPIIIKMNKLTKESSILKTTTKNIHLPYFIKYLKEGLSLNLKSPYTDHPYFFPTDDPDKGNLKNITKIQLLNNNEIEFTYLDDSNNSQTYSIFPKDNIQSYIKYNFLGEGILPYIDTPKVYVKLVDLIFNRIELTKE
jgi:hypothetical protein